MSHLILLPVLSLRWTRLEKKKKKVYQCHTVVNTVVSDLGLNGTRRLSVSGLYVLPVCGWVFSVTSVTCGSSENKSGDSNVA